MNLWKEKKSQLGILYIGFNQDFGCFACGTETGFVIYNVDPIKERFRREFDGGVGIVEMLFRCNILALVGGGAKPKFPPNHVIIWDDYQNKVIADLEFRSDVRAVKLRRNRIVVVLENKVYVYDFADLQLLHQLETSPNVKGLCALSSGANTVLAVLGPKQGTVRIENFDQNTSITIPAHNTALSQIVLNMEGTRLATASERGTLIRIFDTKTGEQLKELRRGADKAEIQSLVFSPNSAWVCVSSDKGTVHIYGLAVGQGTADGEDKTRQSSLSFMKGVLPNYFSSEWSFSSFHIPESRSLVCFAADKDVIFVVCSDGSFYSYAFDALKGGECRQEAFTKFMKETNKSN
jgi:hypothetical protein